MGLMIEPLVLAIDQGTTSSRAVVFDRTGRIVSSAQQEHAQLFPRPGIPSQTILQGRVRENSGAAPNFRHGKTG